MGFNRTALVLQIECVPQTTEPGLNSTAWNKLLQHRKQNWKCKQTLENGVSSAQNNKRVTVYKGVFLGLSVSLLYFCATRAAGWKSSFWKVSPEWRVQLCSDSSPAPGLKWNQRCFSSRLPVIFALCKYTVLHLEFTKKEKRLKIKKRSDYTQSWYPRTLCPEMINVCWQSIFSLDLKTSP